MTAPQPATPGSDSVREEIAQFLPHHGGCMALYPNASTTSSSIHGPCTCWHIRLATADVLAPLVDRLRAEAKAEALEEAALELSYPDPRGMWRASDVLRDRAAAYRTNPSSEEQS